MRILARGAVIVSLLAAPSGALAQRIAASGSTPAYEVHPPQPRPDVPPLTAPTPRPRHPPAPAEQWAQPRDLFLATPQTYGPHASDRSHRRRGRSAREPRVGYLPGLYLPSTLATPTDDVIADVDAPGYVQLAVQPVTAQVFVDGYYVAGVGDLEGTVLALRAGPHRIELRATGRITSTFDLKAFAGETILYRETLAPQRVPARQSLTPAAAPKTFYVVPGCYAGDRRPDQTSLPAGCDLQALQTR